MKILYVVHQFFPRHITGTETYTSDLAVEMKERGNDVEVLCYEHSTFDGIPARGIVRDTYRGIEVTRFCYDSRKWKEPALYEYSNPIFGEMARDFLAKFNPDIVHFTHNSLLSTSVLDAVKARDIPTMLSLTDFWYLCPRMQLVRNDGTQCEGPGEELRCLDCHYLANGSDITAPLRRLLPTRLRKKAEKIREAIRKKIILAFAGKDRFIRAVVERPKVLKQKMELFDVVIAPTIYLRDVFLGAGYEKEQFRLMRFGINKSLCEQRRGAAPGNMRLGFIGTLSPHKGAHIVIDALKAVQHEGVDLVVYGDEKQFPDYAKELRKSAEGEPRIKFCGTFAREDIGKVLAEIDVLVIPSLWHENSPLILLFALACRVPVIASDSGGLRELIQDGVNGLLFERGDTDMLAKHIKTLADDNALLEKLRSAPVSVKSIKEHSDEIESIYHELLSG